MCRPNKFVHFHAETRPKREQKDTPFDERIKALGRGLGKINRNNSKPAPVTISPIKKKTRNAGQREAANSPGKEKTRRDRDARIAPLRSVRSLRNR